MVNGICIDLLWLLLLFHWFIQFNVHSDVVVNCLRFMGRQDGHVKWSRHCLSLVLEYYGIKIALHKNFVHYGLIDNIHHPLHCTLGLSKILKNKLFSTTVIIANLKTSYATLHFMRIANITRIFINNFFMGCDHITYYVDIALVLNQFYLHFTVKHFFWFYKQWHNVFQNELLRNNIAYLQRVYTVSTKLCIIY